jgi:WD40 repeat protein
MLIAQIEGNPYKGLRAFQETDAETFFGRSELTKQLTNHLTNTSFLAVVGPSGSGKSSVVKAGLLPALRAGAIDGSDEWFITEMIPGTHPLEELEAALLRIAVNPPSSLIEPLEKDDRGLVRTLKRILPITVDSHGQPPTLLLVIDQFEELFTLVDQQTRNLFLNNLLAALRDSRCRLRVVTTLRADFYDRPLQLPALADYIKADTVVVTPLTGVELEESIAGPAALAGTRLEDGLVARIIDDVHDQPGMLPLLQYALTELYERREDDSMTHAAYDALGGIQSVLGRRAEELYTGSTQVEQTLTRQLFLRLVTLGEGVEDTRRRVLQSELLSLGHSGQGEGRDAKTLTSLILQHFGEARLLSFDRDPITRTPTVEVAHEALLREWPRLRAWIEESRDDVRLQRLIAVSAAEWLAADKDAGFLLRGSRLDQFKGWAAATTVALAPDERIYLSTSSEARRLRVTEEEARRQRELETAQQLAEEQRQRAEIQSRSTKRLSYLVAGLIAILLVAIGAAWLAFVSQQQAQENFIESERIRLASQAQNAITRGESGELSMLLALNSLQNGYSPVADAALQTSIAQGLPEQIYVGHTDDIQHVQFSADGRKLLTASSDRTARIWDVQTGEELQRFVGHTATIISLDLSADNNHLLSSGADATVRLWNARTGEELFQFPGSPSAAGIDFTADGTQFLITVPGKVEFRSVATGEIVKQFSAVDGDGYDSEFSPNEAYILVTSLRGNSKARIWDATTGVPIIEFVGHEGWIGDSDFSPDNRYVFTVGQDGTARIWEVATGKELRRFEGHTDALFSGDYSPDGLTVLTGSYDKTVRLWDVMSGRELRQIRGHTDFAHGVFSPDGRYIATAGGDHVAKLWDISGNTEPAMRADFSADHFQDQTAISVSDDGQFVLVGRLSGVVDVISMSSGETVYELNTSLSQVNTQTLSPDGQLVVSGDSDGNVSLWNVVKGEPVWTFTGHDGPIRDVGFTKDGSQILTASEDGTARLIDRHSGMQTQQFSGHEDAVHSICATNSGDKVLTTSADGTVRLWDALSGAETRQFSGQSGATNNGVFSPDETMIAAGGTDRSTRLWQVDDGTLVQELIGHTGSILEVEFSANGQILLTGSEDQTARLWDIATGKEIHQYAGHISPIWEARFAPDGEHVFTADSRAVFEWLTTLDDLVALACDRLTRDLTEPERRFYNISGDKPTCEAHSEQLVVAEPTWTPIAAIPAPPPIAVEFMVMETANIQMGMPIQHVYVEDDEGMIIRPITLDENILDLPLFNSTETISDTLVPPFDVGPFPKGDPLGFTMREWISASGHGTYVLKDGRAQVDLEFHNLVPSGVYTLWCVKFNNDPFEILEEIACGLPDGSENNILVDEHGYGTISLEMDAFPLSTQDAVYELAVAYHSDGQTYGNHPGEYGKNLHAHMIFDFLPPDP